MAYKFELRDVHGFLQIARAGSLTAAAAAHNIPKATLSHSLRRLEDALQVELFTRKTRGMELTDAGREYFNNCTQIFDACEAAAGAAQRAHSTVSGRVKIAASAEFGTSIIGAAAHFLAQSHAQIDFDLQMYPHDRLIAGQTDFDCMIYVGHPPDSSLLARKMGEVSYGLYASPAFIGEYGAPKTADALNGLNGVVYTRSGIEEEWRLSQGGKGHIVTCHPRFRVNEYWMAKYFAVKDSVLAYLPDFFVHYEVDIGTLVPVLPQAQSEPVPVYVLYPAHRHRHPRIMMLVDALCEHFGEFIYSPGYTFDSSD
jgi:DNA-binding transcriptional LysR family regulator